MDFYLKSYLSIIQNFHSNIQEINIYIYFQLLFIDKFQNFLLTKNKPILQNSKYQIKYYDLIYSLFQEQYKISFHKQNIFLRNNKQQIRNQLFSPVHFLIIYFQVLYLYEQYFSCECTLILLKPLLIFFLPNFPSFYKIHAQVDFKNIINHQKIHSFFYHSYLNYFLL